MNLDPTIKWWHRIQMPDGSYTPGEVVHGPDGGDWPTTRFGLPEDMTGMKVLDIGAWDGFFSFEAEKRGAELVVATDIPEKDGGNWGANRGFREAHAKLNSKVEWRKLDISSYEDRNDIIKEFGLFDVVMCFGVLYHIPLKKNVNRVIYNLGSLCNFNGIVLIETASSTDRTLDPVIEHKPGYQGDPTNYWYPNPAYVMKEASLYGKGEIIHDMGIRFTLKVIV